MKALSKSWVIPFQFTHDITDTENGSSGIFRTDIIDAEDRIKKLCTILSNEGWEIKCVIPLTSGMVYGTALINEELLSSKVISI